MSARDELAELIFVIDNRDFEDPKAKWEQFKELFDESDRSDTSPYVIADGLIAAGYTREGAA